MRAVRIYQAGDYTDGDKLELSDDAAQHVAIVLRMQAGASLILFNGKNQEFNARIVSVRKRQVQVDILSSALISRESPLSIHLGQALAKGDRMETVVQKAVELGVFAITPLITERCAVKLDTQRLTKRIQQWQAIAIAACEQCGRNTIPVIHPVMHLTDFAKDKQQETNVVLSPLAAKNWRNINLQSLTAINLAIGPEGGFSQAEEQFLHQHHFAALSLGPRILRTETAAITAVSVLQAAYGDL